MGCTFYLSGIEAVLASRQPTSNSLTAIAHGVLQEQKSLKAWAFWKA